MPANNARNLPVIAPKSPLAEGATVNLRPAGDQTQLRIWIAGAPVEDSLHATPTHACKKLLSIVLERMGGQAGVVGILLGALARAEMGSE